MPSPSAGIIRRLQTAALYEQAARRVYRVPGLPLSAYRQAREREMWAKKLRQEAVALYQQAQKH
jgi:hypothetical protein